MRTHGDKYVRFGRSHVDVVRQPDGHSGWAGICIHNAMCDTVVSLLDTIVAAMITHNSVNRIYHTFAMNINTKRRTRFKTSIYFYICETAGVDQSPDWGLVSIQILGFYLYLRSRPKYCIALPRML